MSDDSFFRDGMLIILALALPFAFYFRFRARTDEKLDRRQETLSIMIGLRVSAIPYFVAIIAWLMEPNSLSWSSFPLPSFVRWIGLVLVGLGLSLMVWTFYHLGKNLTDTVVTRRDHTLVTSGPYQFVRHPFYLSFFIGLAGNTFAMANWFILIAGIIPIGFIITRTSIEEAKLIERFGQSYIDYQHRTGQFFPKCCVPNK